MLQQLAPWRGTGNSSNHVALLAVALTLTSPHAQLPLFGESRQHHRDDDKNAQRPEQRYRQARRRDP